MSESVSSGDPPYLCGGLPAEIAGGILDVGHTDSIQHVLRAGDRALSTSTRRWILWDIPSRRKLASGDYFRPRGANSSARDAALAGNVALVPIDDQSFELRSARDGRRLSTIVTGRGVRRNGLSAEGTYAYSIDRTTLRAWRADGRLLLERRGDHGDQPGLGVFAGADSLRVVRAEAGGMVTETVDLRGAVLSHARFEGEFAGWFTDGRHFVAYTDEGIRVYTAEGSLAQAIPRSEPVPSDPERTASWPPIVGGHGDYVWTFFDEFDGPNRLRVQRLRSETPASTFEIDGFPKPSRGGTVAFDWRDRVQRLDLTGGEPRMTEHQLPHADLRGYGDDETGAWAIATGSGLIFDSTHLDAPEGPRPMGCGDISSLAGSPSGRVAIATADRKVRVLEARDGSVAWTHTLSLPDVRLRLSVDGRLLFAQGKALQVFALPSVELLHTWSDERDGSMQLADFTISPNGQRVARKLCADGATGVERDARCVLDVTDGLGTPLHRTAPFVEGMEAAFSPSGRLLALATEQGVYASTTTLYADGKVTATIEGEFHAWLDEARLLVSRYRRSGTLTVEYQAVVDSTGKVLATPAFDTFLGPAEPVDADHVLTGYSLFRVSDGASLWNDGNAGEAALAGDHVVYAVRDLISIARWR